MLNNLIMMICLMRPGGRCFIVNIFCHRAIYFNQPLTTAGVRDQHHQEGEQSTMFKTNWIWIKLVSGGDQIQCLSLCEILELKLIPTASDWSAEDWGVWRGSRHSETGADQHSQWWAETAPAHHCLIMLESEEESEEPEPEKSAAQHTRASWVDWWSWAATLVSGAERGRRLWLGSSELNTVLTLI